MLFTTLSKATLAIFLASLILLLSQQANAHSYADCIDWRFKDPKNPSWSDKNGACFGYARRFPLKAKPFAKLDSDSPNRHYQQSHKNPDPSHSLACSDGKQGEEPGADETMGNPISAAYNGKDKRGRNTGVQTVSNPGGELCIRWPAKNHAVPNEKNQPVTIALSEVNPKKDPTQLQFLSNIITSLNYKNCSDKGKDTDVWPCGGCFKLPTNLKPGNVVMQWRWKLNSNEWYTSCADIKIKPSNTTSISHTPTPTSVSHAPTSAPPSVTSAFHTPTSVSHTPTSVSHTPTSVPHTTTSVSHAPTSASPSVTSVSHTPTSVSHAPTSASPPVTSVSHTPTSVSHTTTSVSHTPTSVSHAPTSASP